MSQKASARESKTWPQFLSLRLLLVSPFSLFLSSYPSVFCLVLVAPLTRLPLIILSGDPVLSVCSLPTCDRGSAETETETEREREREREPHRC